MAEDYFFSTQTQLIFRLTNVCAKLWLKIISSAPQYRYDCRHNSWCKILAEDYFFSTENRQRKIGNKNEY